MDLNFTLENIDAAARKFLEVVQGKKVFAFNGEMGAGKTTFINSLCNMLNVQGTISSPTFSIINQYVTTDGKTMYHMDLYRVKNEQEALNAGVEECLYSGNICFVEWPERAPGVFPDDTLYVTITDTGLNSRKVSLNL